MLAAGVHWLKIALLLGDLAETFKSFFLELVSCIFREKAFIFSLEGMSPVLWSWLQSVEGSLSSVCTLSWTSPVFRQLHLMFPTQHPSSPPSQSPAMGEQGSYLHVEGGGTKVYEGLIASHTNLQPFLLLSVAHLPSLLEESCNFLGFRSAVTSTGC